LPAPDTGIRIRDCAKPVGSESGSNGETGALGGFALTAIFCNIGPSGFTVQIPPNPGALRAKLLNQRNWTICAIPRLHLAQTGPQACAWRLLKLQEKGLVPTRTDLQHQGPPVQGPDSRHDQRLNQLEERTRGWPGPGTFAAGQGRLTSPCPASGAGDMTPAVQDAVQGNPPPLGKISSKRYAARKKTSWRKTIRKWSRTGKVFDHRWKNSRS